MSVTTQDGNSALIEAARSGETEVLVELVKAGANLNLQNRVCRSIMGDTCIYMYIGYVYNG